MAKPELRDHRKFLKLKRLLGEPTPHVLGYLDCLWHRGYQTGNPYVGDSLDVEAAAEYPGEPGEFARAAHESGFLDADADGNFVIHDLYEHAPKYAKQRMRRNGFAPPVEASTGNAESENAPPLPQSGTHGPENAPNGTAWSPKPNPNPNPRTQTESPSREQAAAAEAAARVAAAGKGRDDDGHPSPVEFQAAWNDAAKAAGWTLCVKMSNDRTASLRARRKDPHWRENWQAALTRASPILALRGTPGRKWVANADWFLRPGTVLKILEGGYDGWGTNTGDNGHASTPRNRTGTASFDPARHKLTPLPDSDRPGGPGPPPEGAGG